MKKKCFLLALGLFTFQSFVSVAYANPIQFTFTSIITSSTISGVSAGDSVTISILADNGSNGLNSQSWTIGDFISGSLTAGSYWQSYTDGWYSSPSFVAFTTNAIGNLTSSDFYGTTNSPNHQDSFGTGPGIYLYSNAFLAFNYHSASYSGFSNALSSWHVNEQLQSVPEPGTLALLGLGSAGLMFLRRRPKA